MFHYQPAIDKLRAGEAIVLQHGGNSMLPIIKPHEERTIVPCDPNIIELGDIVYCHCKCYYFTHLVKGFQGKDGKRKFLIGNNRGGTNGWIGINKIFGVVVKVGDRVIKKVAPWT